MPQQQEQFAQQPAPDDALVAAALQGQQPAAAGDDAGQSTAAAAATPATLQPSLDPNAASPYTPLSMPTVEPQPGMSAALPAEETPRNLGATNSAGAMAYLADKMLRGIVQGHDAALQQRAVQTQKKLGALQGIYNQSAQQYLDLVHAGVDPSSDEYKQAHNRVVASWQSMMDTVGGMIPQQDAAKRGNGKKDQRPLLARMLHPADANEAMAAWYQGASQLGPPVLHQAAPMLTPAYQAKVRERAETAGNLAAAGGATAQTAVTQARTAGTNAGMDSEIASLETKQSLTDDEMARLQHLREARSGAKPDFKQFKLTNGQLRWYDVNRPSTIPEDATAMQAGVRWTPPKDGAFWDPNLKRYVAAKFDSATNEVVPGSADPSKALPSYLTSQYGGHQSVVRDENGQYIKLDLSTSKAAGAPGGGAGIGTGAGAGTQQPQSHFPARPSGHASASAATPASESTSQTTPSTPGAEATPAPAVATSTQPGATGIFSRTPEQTKALQSAEESMKLYRNALVLARRGSPTDLQTLVMNYVRSQVQGAGRMTNAEISNALNTGSYDMRIKNAWNRAVSGTLDPEYVKDIVQTMQSQAVSAHQAAQGLMHTKPQQQPAAAAPAAKHAPATTTPPPAPTFKWDNHPLAK